MLFLLTPLFFGVVLLSPFVLLGWCFWSSSSHVVCCCFLLLPLVGALSLIGLGFVLGTNHFGRSRKSARKQPCHLPRWFLFFSSLIEMLCLVTWCPCHLPRWFLFFSSLIEMLCLVTWCHGVVMVFDIWRWSTLIGWCCVRPSFCRLVLCSSSSSFVSCCCQRLPSLVGLVVDWHLRGDLVLAQACLSSSVIRFNGVDGHLVRPRLCGGFCLKA